MCLVVVTRITAGLRTCWRRAMRPLSRRLFDALMSGESRVPVGPFEVVNVDPELGRDAIDKLLAAVHLLERWDVRRYGILLRTVSVVLITPNRRGPEAHYHIHRRGLAVRSDVLAELSVESVAALLVHESTHGRLHRLGLGFYSQPAIERVEAICLRNEVFFLKKVPGARSLAEVKERALAEMRQSS